MTKYIMTFLIVMLGMHGRAHALCTPAGEEWPCVVNGVEGTKVCLDNGRFGACSASPPPPPVCPTTIPVPANQFACECASRNMSRCVTAMGGDVTPAACAGLRQTALTLMLITTDAFNWLASLDYCPVVVLDAGNVAHLTGVCSRGCFAGDTEMLTGCADGGEACTTPASQLTADDTLMSLTDQSSVPNIKLEPRSIGRTVRGPEEPPLFVFALGNGSTLRVTQHHPMVLANGSIVEASHVDRGAAFAGSNGKPVAVTSISRERTKGDVYNFETASNTQLGHIIVAEGVLVGDLKLQNNVAFEERSIELRR